MKAIIISAGLGTRLRPLTNDKPKCMLKIKGKTILQRQLEVLNGYGVDDIVVIRGYKKEAIDYPDVRYCFNANYQNNNILESLFYAESEMNDGFILSYSDIFYEKSILAKLLKSKANISLVIDTDWLSHYVGRYQHPVEEAEKVVVKNGRITKIGKFINPNEAHGEFIGLAKFSKVGTYTLRSEYNRVKMQLSNAPFHAAPSLEKAYLTDMIQELIDRGYAIINVDIKRGWVEIDTFEDLQRVEGKIK